MADSIPALRTTPAPVVDARPNWVERRYDRKLSSAERDLVSLVCDAMRWGPWTLRWTSLTGNDRHASVAVRDDRMATYDIDCLTRLVILAHDRCLRVHLGQSGPGRISISISRREREGDLTRRHPTIEEAIADVRRDHPVPELAGGPVADADPATLGRLLARVREVHQDPTAHLVPTLQGWHVVTRLNDTIPESPTEAAALVVALEVARG